jgi:hypothetical protein
MRPLTTAEIFHAWEAGLDQSLPARAVGLLRTANPDLDIRTLTGLTVGQRDGLLLTLREWTFGPHMTALAACPQCRERVELGFETGMITSSALEEFLDHEKGREVHSLQVSSTEGETLDVRFRLPAAADMLAMAEAGPSLPEPEGGQLWLLKRCLVSAEQGGQAVTMERLGDAARTSLVEAVSTRMAELDPQADVQLSLTCPACGHRWLEPFDILSYFWSEIQRWAQQMLVAIHTLARAYGWREADVLALSPRRRQFYLEMVAMGSVAR